MRIIFIFFYCSCLINLTAQTKNLLPSSTETTSIFQKIVKEGYHEITIKGNFEQMITDKRFNEELIATITLASPTKENLTLPVKVGPRGVYRRQKCSMPPLRLNFSKETLREIGVNPKFDKLKLVTNCLGTENGQQALIRELLAYQMYHQITARSFEVQLIEITLIEASNSTIITNHYAFLIENAHEMANRIGGKLLDTLGLTANNLQTDAYHNNILFNYMIGNLDVNFEMQKNMEYVKIPGEEKLIVVSYDFDYSTFAFPEYIKLNSNYHQKDIYERFAVGKVTNFEKFAETSNKILHLESQFLANINKQPLLTISSKQHLKSYLKPFFRALKKGRVQADF